MKHLLWVLLLLTSPVALANWQLDQSGTFLGFATVKNDLIAENHSFTTLTGGVSATGEAAIMIDVSSVETLIPIRNERMREMLFNTATFPLATATTSIDIDKMTAMKVGEHLTEKVDLNINLHGTALKKSVTVKVTRSGIGSFEVASLGPIVIHASQFSLSEGVERLREVAGLQSIDLMVPVSFNLRFVNPNATAEAPKEAREPYYRSMSKPAQTGQ